MNSSTFKLSSKVSENSRSVLVTGGAGYVGSILLRELLSAGYHVICVDALKFGGQSLVDVWDHPSFSFAKVDITNFNAIDEILNANELFAIVHLAAIVGDPACKRKPDLARKTNRDASIHLFEKAKSTDIERFVFASTCSNYGKMPDAEGYVDEKSPLAPVSLYAELKVEFEKILLNREYGQDGFFPTSLRFATVYGMSPRMRFDLTINEFTKELALGNELVVYGEQFWRPYCHVKDLSYAILAVLQASPEKVAHNVFNVGDTSQNFTKQMIVDELLRQIPDGRVNYMHKEEDPRDYRVNFDKIHEVLGFKITKTVPEGMNDILRAIQLEVIEEPNDRRYYNIAIEN